jgi:hypothetical protein
MDPTLLSLLDSIPRKPPRSRNSPRTDPPTISTIHSFVKVRAKHRKQVQYAQYVLLEDPDVQSRARSDPRAFLEALLR